MSIMHGELQGKEAKQNYARQPIWLLNELSGLHSCGPLKLSSLGSGQDSDSVKSTVSDEWFNFLV
jgi:hypothetical protein